MKKVGKIIYIVGILLGLFVLFLGMLFGGRESSGYEAQTENEESASTYGYATVLESYLAKNFAGRSSLLSAYNTLSAGLFQSSNVEDVIVGKEGYLFFGDTLKDYWGQELMSDEEIEMLADAVLDRAESYEAQGISFLLLIAPNKNSICGEYMPSRYGKAKDRDKSNAYRLMQALEKAGGEEYYVNMFELLGDEEYYLTDTHWNGYGAAKAFTAASGRKVELTEYEEDFSLTGDLQRMLMPDAVANEMELWPGNQHFTYLTRTRSVEQDYIESRNEEGKGSLVLYRDSFANNLIPFFSESYEYAIYDKRVPYQWEDADTYEADLIIVEIAERNLPYLMQYLEG